MSDTITAIATPIGVGGLGVIRISGDEAFAVADKIFRTVSAHTTLADAKSHTIHYGHIVNPQTGETVDEVMAAVMRAPRTFTAENVVEISTHGSPLVLRRVLELIIEAGARMAQAGEFTKRAFLNGRLDLSRAEAVLDVIHADSDISLKSAMNRLEGGLMYEIDKIREPLLYTSAQFAAAVDYPDDEIADLSEESLRKTLTDAIDNCKRLISGADCGRIARDGVVCAIAGRPNVGKSSLLNLLTNSQRAIVTDIEGTTRDIIEESVIIDGVAVRLFDTAGIRDANDEVEKIGVARSKDCIGEADLVLLVFDGSTPLTDEDREMLALTEGKKRIFVINKSDLPSKLNTDMPEFAQAVSISTKTAFGIDELKRQISDICAFEKINSSNMLISNMRHLEALTAAKASLENALDALNAGIPMDMCSIDVSSALESLGLITGASVSTDIADKIFAEFCVGK